MRLLLIEDDAQIARELLLRWRAHGWMVHASATLTGASGALESAAAQGFDVIVLDLGLPDGDGLDWLVSLRRHDRQTPTLVLTARDRVADRVTGLNSGADDYVIKPFAPEELDARVLALARRIQAARGESLRFGNLTWKGEDGKAYVSDQLLTLMPREFEVLGFLIQRAPRIASKRALIDALAQRNQGVSDSVAEVYVSRLRHKLAGSGVGIRTMRGFGYVLVPETVG